jgi:hypothetical protein
MEGERRINQIIKLTLRVNLESILKHGEDREAQAVISSD